MTSIRNVLMASLLASGTLLTAASGISTAIADDQIGAPPPQGPAGWHHHGGQWHLLGELGLSDAQKQSIKEILSAANPQMESLHEQARANMLKMNQTRPTDPNYSTIASQVSQTQGSLTAQLVSQQAEIRAQIFKILTPAQQTQLATLEAERQARHPHGGQAPPPVK